MSTGGGEYITLQYSSLGAKRFRQHVVSTWLSDEYDSCFCCNDRLDDASDADTGFRESAIEGKLTLGVEGGAILYEGDNRVSLSYQY